MRSQLSQRPKNFALRSEPIGAQRPFAWQPIVAAIVPINCYRTAKGTTSLKCRDNALSWERLGAPWAPGAAPTLLLGFA